MAILLKGYGLHGNEVSGSVLSGDINIPFSKPVWGQPVMPSSGILQVNIELKHNAAYTYAPCPVQIHITCSGYVDEDLANANWKSDYHRVYYRTTWGDPDGGQFTVAQGLPDEFRDRNVSYGPDAGHVYRKPGTYVIIVEAFDRAGNYGWDFETITVAEDDFVPSETIVVAPDGDFTGAPYCIPANRCTTISQLNTLVLNQNGEKRLVYFKRGTTVKSATGYSPNGHCTVRAYGNGAKPTIHFESAIGGTLITTRGFPFRIQNIAFKADWDARTETVNLPGARVDANHDIFLELTNNADFLADLCEENGTAMFINFSVKVGGRCFIHEHKRTNHKNFMFLGGGEQASVAVIGCNEHQLPDALHDGMNRDEFNIGNGLRYLRNAHNGVRFGSCKCACITNNHLLEYQGWTLQGYVQLDNAAIRTQTNGGPGAEVGVGFLTFTRNLIEGSFTNTSAAGGSTSMAPVNFLIAMNVFMGNPLSAGIISFMGMGVTVRDNLLIRSNHPTGANVASLRAMISVGLNSHPLREFSPNEIYNNTLIDLAESQYHDKDFTPIQLSGHTNTRNENNVYYAPNLNTPNVVDGPVTRKPLPIEASYRGVRYGYEQIKDLIAQADTPPGESLLLPYPMGRQGQLKQSDFAGAWTRNKITFSTPTSNDEIYGGYEPAEMVYNPNLPNHGPAKFTFQADGISIQNNGTATWPSGPENPVRIILDRGTTPEPLDTKFNIPAGVLGIYETDEASGAHGSATGDLVSLFDLLGNPRRGSGHRDAPAGLPSRGALEAA